MPILADKIEIQIEGKKIENYKYSHIQLVQELQRPNKLTFCLHKDDLLQDENAIRYSLTEKLLGKKVELMIKTVREKEKKLENDILTFTGIVFNVNILKKNLGAGSIVEVTAYSPDYLLFDHPHCFSYEKKQLKDIVSQTIEPYNLDPSINPAQEEELPYTVQYNETNYNFLRRLSTRYGEWFYYDGEKLVFGKLEKKNTETLTLGNDVNDYHYRLQMNHLQFSHAHHNYLEYGNTKANALDSTDNALHNLTDVAYDYSKDLYEKDTFQHLRSSAPEDSFDETAWSAKVQGAGEKAQLLTCYGSSIRADLRIGSVVQIEESFDKEKGGTAQCNHDELVIYKLIHLCDGVSSYENLFAAIPADSEFPPYTYGDSYPKAAPQRAVVKENIDPDKLGRVRVQFLWQKEQNEELMTPWIRIAQPYGGEDKGFFFIPEIDEEVMVGFENENAEKPYVLGTLWHGEQRPREGWYTESDNNDVKVIRTRRHTIGFCDKEGNGFIGITDRDGNFYLRFDIEKQLILLESKGNIVLNAENDIILDAKNNIKIKAGREMDINAGGNINETAGANVNIGAADSISINAANNMDTFVGSNSTLNVSSNQTVEIGGSKDESIGDKYQLTASTIREEGTDMLILYGNEIEERADSTLKLDGSSLLDIYAGSIRLN